MKTMMMYLFLILFSSTAKEPAIVGTWKMSEENIEVEIIQDGDVCTGVIVKAPKEGAVGTEILRDLKEKKGKWEGKLYAIRKGRLVDVVIVPKEDELDLEVSAGFVSKSMSWKRVD